MPLIDTPLHSSKLGSFVEKVKSDGTGLTMVCVQDFELIYIRLDYLGNPSGYKLAQNLGHTPLLNLYHRFLLFPQKNLIWMNVVGYR